ncbi:MAG: RHS repeat-associated core domain-containing protein, partial [bacterium]|nr:RHS repeat-associated core domain-containing protein [bacterium]
NARYYQSDIGKFISQDPFLKRMGDLMSVLSDPQALNSYSYAGNNPVKNTDTTGEVAAEAAASLGWLPFMDGPIPIGDIIYAAAVGTALGIDAYVWVTGSGGKDYSLSSPSPTATPNDNYRDAIMRMSEAGTAGASGASMSGNVGSGGPEDLNPWKDGHKKIDIAQKRISNTINDLNRPGGKIGDGSTAAAVRHQIKTGEMVGRRDHVLKAYNSIRGLNNHIKTLSQYGDKFKLVIRRAQREINKLNRALKTKPRK